MKKVTKGFLERGNENSARVIFQIIKKIVINTLLTRSNCSKHLKLNEIAKQTCVT